MQSESSEGEHLESRQQTSSNAAQREKRKRIRSSQKEKRRNLELNKAFRQLQEKMPHIPKGSQLPKIKTLRLALRYINHLKSILEGDFHRSQTSDSHRPLNIDDFAMVALNEIQSRNSYTERIYTEELLPRKPSAPPSEYSLSPSFSAMSSHPGVNDLDAWFSSQFPQV